MCVALSLPAPGRRAPRRDARGHCNSCLRSTAGLQPAASPPPHGRPPRALAARQRPPHISPLRPPRRRGPPARVRGGAGGGPCHARVAAARGPRPGTRLATGSPAAACSGRQKAPVSERGLPGSRRHRGDGRAKALVGELDGKGVGARAPPQLTAVAAAAPAVAQP